MEDCEIIALYRKRSESAISETDRKYGSYCRSVSFGILANREDTEECVNDTYLHTWNAIPPACPDHLMVFLGKIARNISLDLLRKNKAKKRGGEKIRVLSEELEQCISPDSVEIEIDRQILAASITRFLKHQPRRQADIFLRRYWYADSVREIAERYGMRENAVTSVLFRMRKRLKNHLQKESIVL